MKYLQITALVHAFLLPLVDEKLLGISIACSELAAIEQENGAGFVLHRFNTYDQRSPIFLIDLCYPSCQVRDKSCLLPKPENTL